MSELTYKETLFVTAVSRLTAQQWCIEHGFELVELEPEANSDDEGDCFVMMLCIPDVANRSKLKDLITC